MLAKKRKEEDQAWPKVWLERIKKTSQDTSRLRRLQVQNAGEGRFEF